MGEVPFPGVQIVSLSASSRDGAELTSMLGPRDMDDSALSLKEITARSARLASSSKCLGRVGTYTLNPTEGGLPPCHTLS